MHTKTRPKRDAGTKLAGYIPTINGKPARWHEWGERDEHGFVGQLCYVDLNPRKSNGFHALVVPSLKTVKSYIKRSERFREKAYDEVKYHHEEKRRMSEYGYFRVVL